ncbi:SGNH/GDSL hydrolase family protein [Nocardia crassostreae]|uniref:SGNH/GDSL hydrolase family protein n=1 Tax=Nocardia crassostreae TaxID=53428 RepID=UPI00082B7EE2|nr:SGNH/GDSL hydrolase family protein [Nocardia crassostreae]
MHPTPTAIQNLIVLGDSLSDIGIKRTSPAGVFARAANLMRTNEVGRYSDGKNWTDFVVEWMGGQSLIGTSKDDTENLTKGHRALTAVQSNVLGSHVGQGLPVRYANYAEGGAIAGSDYSPAGLGHLKDQFNRYINARLTLLGEDIQVEGTPSKKRPWRKTYTLADTADHEYSGQTLHVVWIGLNDLITAKRPCPDGKKPKAGTGIEPLITEIWELVNLIPNSLPTNPAHEHFILVDLPSPLVSVRFQDMVADNGEESARQAVDNVRKFNLALKQLATNWPPPGAKPTDGPGANPANISFVAMSDWMQFVSDHAGDFHLTPLAQEHGPVVYLGQQDTLPPKLRRAMTTSDLAHPTAAVYELIGRQIVDVMLNAYTLGKLDRTSWQAIRPFATIK